MSTGAVCAHVRDEIEFPMWNILVMRPRWFYACNNERKKHIHKTNGIKFSMKMDALFELE